MKRFIFWDLDGTLINSYEGVTKCIQYALEPYGIHVEGEQNLRKFIGPPLRKSFPEYAGLPEKYVEEAVDRYRERYIPIGVYECELYPGVRETIDLFRQNGLVQTLASSKPEAQCRQVLDKFSLTQQLDDVVGASHDGRIDTKVQVLEEAFRRMKAAYPSFSKEETVLIGDTRFDVDGAKEAGIECIGVSYGFGTREELLEHGAAAVCNDLRELQRLILGQR